jgi:hypothetical protein
LDLKYPFIVETDAINKAVGASLLQEITIRRKLLGVVFKITQFKRFLIGREFESRTDHRPLVGWFVRETVIEY